MKAWHLVLGSAGIWWGLYVSLFLFGRQNVQVTCFPAMGFFLRAADSGGHWGYENHEFWIGAAVSISAFLALGVFAIAKKSLPIAATFASLLSLSSLLAMLPSIER